MKPGSPGHLRPDHPTDDPSRPERLPAGFTFVRTLGTGTGGWVVLARQTAVGREVAVKTVVTGIRSREASLRLRREGRAIATLDHPNIVRVFDLVAGPSEFWLVMEHVAGLDLDAAIRTSTLGGARRVEVLADVAAALAHAHAHGMVHRDVKPANVLVDAGGVAKLADFGIARLPAAIDAFRSVDVSSWGTPWYMAPEQVEDPSLNSAAVDVYAFAVVAYEVLVGVGPFGDRDPAGMMRAHREEAPTDPRFVIPSFPASAARVLLAGLAKDPRLRPTPAAIAGHLTRIGAATWDTVVAAHPTREPVVVRTPTVGQSGRADGSAVVPAFDGRPRPPAPVTGPSRAAKRPIRTRMSAWAVGSAVGVGAAVAIVELTTRR